MPRDSASQVLAGLLTNDVQLIDDIGRVTSEDHFTDPTLRSLFRSILTYRSIGGGVLGEQAIDSLTDGADAGTAALLRETFDALRAGDPTPPDVARFAADKLRKDYEKRLTQVALREASDILVGSITEEGRGGQPGRTWSGAADAREWAELRIGEINTETQISEAPAADVVREGRSILEEYLAAAREDKSRRPRTGIEGFDELVGGLGKGLIMIAGSSGFGKTQFCVNLAYYSSQHQGLHVYFATSETVRSTVRARLVARHSRHEKFAEYRERFNLPHGLDSQMIDRGTLPHEHVEYLARVAVDWGAQGESSTDGTCFVAQMPHGQTMSGLQAQIGSRMRVVKPDLVVIDYIALMSSLKRHASTREELSSVVKEAAHFSVDFNKGEGIPCVSPWQLNRESQKEMTRTGQLDTSGLAETAEAVNSAHLVAALAPDGARDGRFAGLKINILKNRDGQVLIGERGIPTTVDYATSLFESRVGAAEGGDPFSELNGGFDADQAAGLVPGLL